MNELESLIRQKKELEEKIIALKNQYSQFGLAKVAVERYPTLKPDRHFLAVHYKPIGDGRAKWQTIYSANSRQEVIEAIPGIISDLQSLYSVMIQPKKEET